LKPFDGNAVMEINSSLIFPILEILLGGDGKLLFNSQRETTEVEQVLLDGLMRLILRDLHEAWQFVADISFTLEKMERSPQQLKVLSPSEAVVAVAIEVKIGDNTGMVNIAIPSIHNKMMRQKFDQQWTLRKTDTGESDQQRTLHLIRRARLWSDVRLTGPELMLSDLEGLETGDVLNLQTPASTGLELLINGRSKFRGHMVAAGRRATFRIAERITDPAHALRRIW
jgi:flagellar motor switch protein FliM